MRLLTTSFFVAASILDFANAGCFNDCKQDPGRHYLCAQTTACDDCPKPGEQWKDYCDYLCDACENTAMGGIDKSGCNCDNAAGNCFEECNVDAENWMCDKPLACSACHYGDVCDSLCAKCPPGQYGGLDCSDRCPGSDTAESPVQEGDPDVTCYEQFGWAQSWTTETWWTSGSPPPYTQWATRRQKFQPLGGSTSMVAAALYSFSRGNLRVNAIFAPLIDGESRNAEITVANADEQYIQDCTIRESVWNCVFEFQGLDQTADYTYNIRYHPIESNQNQIFTYGGDIPAPVDNPRMVVLSCFGYDNDVKEKTKLVNEVLALNPDIILLNGDQTYEHFQLGYGFLETVFTLQNVTKNRPTIVQMDDHDWGQGNIYGADDDADHNSGSGFVMPVCLVNLIQYLMMSGNPTPATDLTLNNGITIHYGSYEYGRFDFAILEARKFKNDPDKGNSLLGLAQETWLRDDWCIGAGVDNTVRVVLAQTPFANLRTHITNQNNGGIVANRVHPDPNASPETARDRAMGIFADCTSLVISGDQHIGIAVRYEEYGITGCVAPAAINSIFWRLNYNATGQTHIDPSGNEYTLLAVWNVDQTVLDAYSTKIPEDTEPADDEVKDKRADGFLVVDFQGLEATCEARHYRMPRGVEWSVKAPLLAGSTKPPSLSPSAAPSTSPSKSPTEFPTASPTDSPSDSPTGSPSDSPTGSPSSTPTSSPSGSPTGYPSSSPSGSPSDSPTGSPSDSPTGSPSDSPTGSPSDSPSGSPSSSPSGSPSDSPTGSPSDSPTGSPSDSPSEPPTGSPSSSPSVSPSESPTDFPTEVPTVPPVAARTDTSPPTPAPSAAPTYSSEIAECYDDPLLNNKEKWTARDWWNFSKPLYAKHIDRSEPFTPMVGDETLIAGVLFTVSKKTLKMSAIFAPLFPVENRQASLLLVGGFYGTFFSDTCEIIENIWLCEFRFDNFADDEYSYVVQYKPDARSYAKFRFAGSIPAAVENPKIVAVNGFGVDETLDGVNTIDKGNLVRAILDLEPDLLIIQGDMTYRSNALGLGTLEIVYTLRDVLSNTPAIVQMDEHDYGQGSLFGAERDAFNAGTGFDRPPCFVNLIQKLAMGHNPDPVNAETLLNGIESHYTNYEYGNLDFAVLEARKYKSRPGGVDSMLGDSQEAWLAEWCSSTSDKTRIILTQTPFANIRTHYTHTSKGGLVPNEQNPDPNGQPVAGRIRAMEIIKDCASLIISGDMHFGIAVSYDDYEVTECVAPAAINSVFWRINNSTVGKSYQDPEGNNYSLLKAWNVAPYVAEAYDFPKDTESANDTVKDDRGDGFLVVDINGMEAVCEAHRYRLNSPTPVIEWDVHVNLMASPTGSPTAEPTGAPSVSPTVVHSETPSTAPSGSPSDSPSVSPTDVPSASPSETPSASPSGSPTDFPSALPTDAPSATPSDSPTDFPSATPSDSPTDFPSATPSDSPTDAPSATPSDSPTAPPTDPRYDPVSCYNDELLDLNERWTSRSDWRSEGKPSFASYIDRDNLGDPIVGFDNLIAGVLFSFTRNVLKVGIFFPPLFAEESFTAELVVTPVGGGGDPISTSCRILENIWHAVCRVDGLTGNEYTYEVIYSPTDSIMYRYPGTIHAPVENPRVVVLSSFGNDDFFDKNNLTEAIMENAPDVVVLNGAKTYRLTHIGFGFLDVVYQLRDVFQSAPTMVLMDSQDYGQPHLYGSGNNAYDSGSGFTKLPVCLINLIQRLMMGHNPDPATDATLQNGIEISYTSYQYGAYDFALTEGRKFKSRQGGHSVETILGEGQESWLQDWCKNDKDKLKIVLTQTPFAFIRTHIVENNVGEIFENINHPSLNASPQKGRTDAMEIFRDCTSLIISGDQNLGIAVLYSDYGITEVGAPAAINSMAWRLNYNDVRRSYKEHYGNQYTLLKVWNVDDSVIDTYEIPKNTCLEDTTADVMQGRADGYLSVTLNNNNAEAVCQAHTYRVKENRTVAWTETVPLSYSTK